MRSTARESSPLTWPRKMPWRDSSRRKSKSKVRDHLPPFLYLFIYLFKRLPKMQFYQKHKECFSSSPYGPV